MEPSKKEKFRQEKKEAYESIGEFVVQFEHLSLAMKTKIKHLIGLNEPISILLEPYTFRQTVDVLKKITSLKTKNWRADHPDRELYKILMKDLNKLNEDRNSLIHSTWFVGWAGDKTETVSEFNGRRFNGSSKKSSTKYVQELTNKCTNLYQVFWTLWSIEDTETFPADFLLANLYYRTDDGLWKRKE